jgi:hypothetical protein
MCLLRFAGRTLANWLSISFPTQEEIDELIREIGEQWDAELVRLNADT